MLLIPTKIGQSAIEGIGLFAAEFIPQGALIWRYQSGLDFKIDEVLFQSLSAEARKQVLNYAYRSKESPVYVMCGDDARFFNHSATPNVVDDAREEGIVIAARDIQSGEELTCDYRTFDAHFQFKFPESNRVV